ncbi:MAG: prepilin peptidase [Vulcanimicrobiota bacterium]
MTWFWTTVATVYGMLVGSFLNVCIFRLPPRVFCFDDLFYESRPSDLFGDIFLWWKNLFNSLLKKKKKKEIKLEPFLYAEAFCVATIMPESVITGVMAHTFNIYKEFLGEELSVSRPARSFCPKCGEMIKWWMNIPVFSYILLGGKCYYCKGKISPRYALNELLSGLICGSLFYVYGTQNLFVFFYYYLLAALCIVVFWIDFDHWLILDEITVPFSLAGTIGAIFVPAKYFTPVNLHELGWSMYNTGELPATVKLYQVLDKSLPTWIHLDSFLHSLVGAIFWFAAFYIIGVVGTALAKREAMGGGDIKFALLLGAFLGAQKTAAVFFVSVLVGVAFMAPMLLMGRKTGKDQVPFGCFLTVATLIVIYLGDKIIYYYLNWPELLVNIGF